MAVDPQIQALLDRGTGVPATHTLPVAEARRQYEARIALVAQPAHVAEITERTIDGPGGPLKLRIYTPVGRGPFPLIPTDRAHDSSAHRRLVMDAILCGEARRSVQALQQASTMWS